MNCPHKGLSSLLQSTKVPEAHLCVYLLLYVTLLTFCLKTAPFAYKGQRVMRQFSLNQYQTALLVF